MEEIQGKFLIVRSSAGSGKTYRLVFEYLKLALGNEDPFQYRHILAVTFTNKAAQEMLERVLEYLMALAKDPDIDKNHLAISLCDSLRIDLKTLKKRARSALEHMLHNYGSLNISTIDGFVNRVVRAFAKDLKVSADYEIELDQDALLEEAVDRCISSIERGSPMATAILRLMLDRSEQERNWRIGRELNAVARNLLNEQGHQNMAQLTHLDIDEIRTLRNELYKELKTFQNKVRSIGEKGLDLIRNSGVETDRFAGGRSGLPSYFARLAEFNKDIEARATQQKNIAEDKWYAGKADPADKQGIDGIKEQLRSLFMESIDLVEKEYGSYIERKSVAENLIALGVMSEVERNLEEIKSEQDILLISDLNKMISKIVLNEPAPFIYERIGERSKHLLFDEFQDTSIMQWWNFLPLVENALSNNGESLVVGDGKQAIYRWRNGEVQQFLKLPEIHGHGDEPNILQKEGILKRYARLESLDTNWRSAEEIISFNNRIFKDLYKYLPADLQSIYEQVEQKASDQAPTGAVRIEQVLDGEVKKGKEIVLEKILEDIDAILGAGGTYQDVTILVRSGSEARLIAQKLEEHKINVISPEALLFNSRSNVRMLMDLLKAMYYESDVAASTRAMAGALKTLGNGEDLHAQMTPFIVQNGSSTALDLDNFLFKKFGIEHSRSMRSLPTFELASYLADGLGLLKDSDRYMTLFLDAILQFNKQKGGGLRQLLEWWELKKDSLGLPVPDSENAVTIMTIHKSKGLQFPVVIVPFANWSSPRSGYDAWFDDPEKEFGFEQVLVKAGPELEKTKFSKQYKEETDLQLLDDLNLLYVAYTRAEQVLISYFGKAVKNTMASLLKPTLTNWPEWNASENSIRIGELPRFEKGREVPTNTSTTLPMSPKPWFGRAVIDTSSFQQFAAGNEGEPLQYGRVVHELMTAIKSKDDVEPALDNLRDAQALDDDVLNTLEEKIKRLFELPEVHQAFQSPYQAMDEREICTADGVVLRPDRVLIDNKDAILIEYKTGEERPTHLEQVNNYAKQLEGMGYDVKQKLILYIDKVKSVSA